MYTLGVLTTTLDVRDLLNARFAQSPLFELVAALRAFVSNRGRSEPPVPWLPSKEREFRQLEVHPSFVGLRDLFATPVGPSFLAPSNRRRMPSIDDELAAIEMTSPDELWRQLDEVAADASQLHAAHDDLPRRIVAGLRCAWDLVMAGHWNQVGTICTRDANWRAEQVAFRGWAAVITDIEPRSMIDGSVLTLPCDSNDTPALSNATGLILMPSALVGPGNVASFAEGDSFRLVYRARGIRAVPTGESEHKGVKALTELIGPRRTRVLLALELPTTTTQLATLLGTSLQSVSNHLQVLVAAALATKRRDGKTVIYSRTSLGDSLAEGT